MTSPETGRRGPTDRTTKEQYGEQAQTRRQRKRNAVLGRAKQRKKPDEPLNEGTGENHHGPNEESEGNADEMLAVRRRAK